MDRYRLKNIIILILALVNLFLLGSLAKLHTAERMRHRSAVEQMSALFASDGILLEADIIPQDPPPGGKILSRSMELERESASLLLGGELQLLDQGGGIYTYSGPSGSALFRSNGSFEASGHMGQKDPVGFCKAFCRKFGYGEPRFLLDEEGRGIAQATRLWDTLPVFNCTLNFTLDGESITAVSGTLLPEEATELSLDQEPLSALAALSAFQTLRKETGAVVSSIDEISLCYELQSSTALPLGLTPVWCIHSNTAKYYVNAITGAVRIS